MRHIAQILGQGKLKHIKHSAIKQHLKKHHLIKGKGTQHAPEIRDVKLTEGFKGKRDWAPLRFKF